MSLTDLPVGIPGASEVVQINLVLAALCILCTGIGVLVLWVAEGAISRFLGASIAISMVIFAIVLVGPIRQPTQQSVNDYAKTLCEGIVQSSEAPTALANCITTLKFELSRQLEDQ